MRVPRSLFVAGLFIGLANPAIAQADPHHPEGGGAPSTVVETPAGDAAQLAAPPVGVAMTQCPDMMGMMQQGGGSAMPMMQMHMMAMMHMQLMHEMQGGGMVGMGGMMRPDAGSSTQMQMMEMMRSMQMTQMGMIQMMQQMQSNMARPADEGAMP